MREFISNICLLILSGFANGEVSNFVYNETLKLHGKHHRYRQNELLKKGIRLYENTAEPKYKYIKIPSSEKDFEKIAKTQSEVIIKLKEANKALQEQADRTATIKVRGRFGDVIAEED